MGLFMAHDPSGKKITKKYIGRQIDIAGKRYPASVSIRPMGDPKNEAIKG